MKYIIAAAAATSLGALLYYKYAMSPQSIDVSTLSDIDEQLYNRLRKAIGADSNEDWILDFEKMKIILKIIFSHVKQLMINQRRELQNGMDYKSWEEIHY